LSVCEIFGGSDHSVLFVFWKVYLGSSSNFFELVSEMLLDAKENHFPDLCFYLRVTVSCSSPSALPNSFRHLPKTCICSIIHSVRTGWKTELGLGKIVGQRITPIGIHFANWCSEICFMTNAEYG
jgi:hypothetical protein